MNEPRNQDTGFGASVRLAKYNYLQEKVVKSLTCDIGHDEVDSMLLIQRYRGSTLAGLKVNWIVENIK